MRLASFIQANAKQIIHEWENFAATLVPAAEGQSPLALRDHIKQILAFVAVDMNSDQTHDEQILKSRGEKQDSPRSSAAKTHAALRLAGGFDMNQMVSEFRALRASVIKLWLVQSADFNRSDISDLTRFHEAIDQVSTEAINHYSKKIVESRELLLDVLKNDMPKSINSMSIAARVALNTGGLNEQLTMLNWQIIQSAARAVEMVAYLLDLTRVRFGSGLPTVVEPMDMGRLSTQMVDEMRVMHPRRHFNLEILGNLEGEWDKARIAQVFSNLIGNAVRYGFSDSPIGVTVEGTLDEVTLSVHNNGVPIPSALIGSVFNSLTRREVEESENHHEPTNVGLGLYITKEVVAAHGGTISVTSSEKDGTIFTVRFPRISTSSQE